MCDAAAPVRSTARPPQPPSTGRGPRGLPGPRSPCRVLCLRRSFQPELQILAGLGKPSAAKEEAPVTLDAIEGTMVGLRDCELVEVVEVEVCSHRRFLPAADAQAPTMIPSETMRLEQIVEIVGLLGFTLSGAMFVLSALRTGDVFALAGSIIWILSCVGWITVLIRMHRVAAAGRQEG